MNGILFTLVYSLAGVGIQGRDVRRRAQVISVRKPLTIHDPCSAPHCSTENGFRYKDSCVTGALSSNYIIDIKHW